MKDTIRTFIAIKIAPEKKLTNLISDLKKSLNAEEIRWVDVNNLHITLRFLGETSSEQITNVITMLESISKQFQPFQFDIQDVGVFKNKTRPRVLFLSVKDDLTLRKLADEIYYNIETLGFKTEENKFNPHLTLGRIKHIQNNDGFNSLLNKFKKINVQRVSVSEILFYQSILGSEGPTYNPIKIINLI